MKSIVKTLLAISLGLGFLILDARAQSAAQPARASAAKPTVAFLGLSRESDPQLSESVTKRIQWELSADTALFTFSNEDVAMLYAKGVLREPQAGPMDMPRLSQGLGAQYYAFGKLEPIAVESKRGRWTPWSIKVKWTQGLRLRVLDGSNGNVVYDGLVTAEVPENALFTAPDGNLGRMAPLERETYLRTMSAAVSVESARMVAKVLKEKAAGAAGSAEAKPQGG
jgi:hypothetical protein